MQKTMNAGRSAGRSLVTFLVGSAVGVGAAFLVWRVCPMRKSGAEATARKPEDQPATPYCDVPEGADICYPDK